MKKIYTEEQRNEILQRYRSGEKYQVFVRTPALQKALSMRGQNPIIKRKAKLSTCRTFGYYGSVAKH